MDRTGFGRYALELRLSKRMSQTEFARRTGWSLSRVSNLEHLRSNISDDVVGVYIEVLDCSGAEAHELRKRATFSNSVRDTGGQVESTSRLQALLKQFGENISSTGRARIQKVLEEETGESLASLSFSSNRTVGRTRPARSTRRVKRPSLTPDRFAQICLIAEQVRRSVAGETERVNVGLLLDQLAEVEANFDYQVSELLPAFAEGAFACITGHADGHTLLIEETRFFAAMQGQHFGRHVIAHEVGHHFLHSQLLNSTGTLYLPPQELAKNRVDMAETSARIEQVVDTLVEVEAECFATFLIVPWTACINGTSSEYLARIYGEQVEEVRRYQSFFKINSVLDAFRHILWKAGQRDHRIFSLP